MATYYIDPFLIDPATGLSVGETTSIIYPGNDMFGQPYVSGPVYKTCSAAYTASAGSNNKFYLRRGRYHDTVSQALFPTTFQSRTDNVFADYGPASDFMPVADCGYWIEDTAAENAQWTYNAANGAWTRPGNTFGASINNGVDARLFFYCTKVNAPYPVATGISTYPSSIQRVIGTPIHRATALANIGPGFTGDSGPWYITQVSTYDLSIWTGDPTKTPPQKWGPLYLVASRANANGFISFRNSANRNKVGNIDVWGAYAYAIASQSLTTSGIDDLEIVNCKATACGTAGFYFVGDSAAGYAITKIRMRNIVIDSKSAPPETSIPNINNADWINIRENVSNLVVDGFTIYAGECHTAVNTAAPGALANPAKDLTFLNGNIYFLPGTTDGRGIGCNDLVNLNFKNVWTYNAPSRGEISGTNIKFKNCGWIGTQYNPNSPQESLFCIAAIATGAVGASMSNIVFDGCVFDLTNSAVNTVGCVATTQYASSTAIPAGAVTIQNCVGICQAGQGFYLQANAGGYGGANNNLVIRNNYMLRPDGIGTHKSGTYQNGVPFGGVDQGFNSFRGATGNLATTQDLSLMTSDYRLKPSSPLIGTGVFTAYQSDKAGNQYYNPPSIGAYEYKRPVTARP